MYSAFGVLLVLGLFLVVATETIWSAIPSLLLGAFVFYIHKGVSINPEARYYQEYNSVLGRRTGARHNYDQIEYLFVTSRRQTQKMNFASVEGNAVFHEYLGWVRFSEKEKLQIMIRDSKDEVLGEMQKLAGMLNTKVVDYTAEEE